MPMHFGGHHFRDCIYHIQAADKILEDDEKRRSFLKVTLEAYWFQGGPLKMFLIDGACLRIKSQAGNGDRITLSDFVKLTPSISIQVSLH